MMSGLESARLKLIRASEHINAIKDSIAAYAASDPYEIVPKADGKEQFNIIREPPTEVSGLSGEVLYQIRSALDHLVFDLVKLNPQKIRLPDGWERRCEFPLLVEVPTKGNPPIAYDLSVPYNLFAKALPGITRQAFTFIESLQPYSPRSQGILGSLNTLKALVKLSNIDKHRHLNVTLARIRKNELVTFDTGAQLGGWTIFDHKAEVEPIVGTEHPMGRAVKTERSFATIVTLGESAVPEVARIPVEYVLLLCTYAVDTLILPKFENLIQHP